MTHYQIYDTDTKFCRFSCSLFFIGKRGAAEAEGPRKDHVHLPH